MSRWRAEGEAAFRFSLEGCCGGLLRGGPVCDAEMG